MSDKDFGQEIALRVRASVPAIYVVAREDWRALQEIKASVKKLIDESNSTIPNLEFRSWTVTYGWEGDNTIDPLDAIKQVRSARKPGVWCMTNFHRFLDDPQMIQTVKDVVQWGKTNGIILVFVSNIWKVPDELQDDLSRLDFSLPDKRLLMDRVSYTLDSIGSKMAQDDMDRVAEAALGMTTWETENALAMSLVETGKIDSKVIAAEKARTVAKTGLLEFSEPGVGMKDVGGLDNLKAWLVRRRKAFSKEAQEYGLPMLKGILLVGVPGCGKSLTAKAIASDWNLPLIRWDMGKMFGSLVGQTEENTRKTLWLAEAVAPCILWADEIEKGMAGAGASGNTDSGVTARTFGAIATWMQERKRPVFLAATANSVTNLPPEFMRAGRWDEIFWVDLPSEKEREEILGIHIRRKGRDPSKFGLEYVAREAAQFSGAELEAVVIKAMFAAFADGRDIATDDLIDAVHVTVPLAVTRREEIESLRKWAATRAIPASSIKPPELKEIDVEKRRAIKMTTYVEEVKDDNGS